MPKANIRPWDLVRLRDTPAWVGRVRIIERGLALVDIGNAKVGRLCWVPLEILELVPGQIEELGA
jgi:hypothetical protein